MKAHPNRLLLVVLALGWLFDLLFWKKAPGINFAVFAVSSLLGGFYLLVADGLRPSRRSLLLLVPIAFFAATTFLRAEPMTSFLAYSFTLLGMSVLAVTYLGGRWMAYGTVDYAGRFLLLLWSMIARPLSFSNEARVAQQEAGLAPSRRGLWAVVRGVVIALPIVVVFAALLSSADVVFGQRLGAVLELFRLEKLPEYMLRLVLILAAAYALAGVILHAAGKSSDEDFASGERRLVAPFLGATEAAIVLGSVVILFAAFVVIQFQYFFGGQANIQLEGYTYAEYARRGFGELVAVAFFALLMLVGLSAATQRETASQRRTFSGLGVTLVLLLLVMLFSAHQRLGLYEAAYGFSRLRTYTHVALVWIGLLLFATIALEVLRMERRFALAVLIAASGFAASLPMLNVDAFIVQQNIEREQRGQQVEAVVDLDVNYFLELSDDAVPVLVEAYQSASLNASVKEQLGASLACMRSSREQDPRGRAGYPWQSFHAARRWADMAMLRVKRDLDRYAVNDDEWPATVITPAGEEFPCVRDYAD